MFEGKNTIILCDKAARNLFSEFLTNKFGTPILVVSLEKDYKGVTITFSEIAEKSDQESTKGNKNDN